MFSVPVRPWLERHPLVRDALLWCVPALLLGLVLRLLLMSYSPFAYWGSDSNSYFSFSELLLGSGKISLYDKRRYLYPIFLLPISVLPGSPLKWLAWIQHTIGLLTLVPLGYCVRKCFSNWRWFIVPVTVVYAGIPTILWYEHELLAENIFFASVIWAWAGWAAWTGEDRPERRAHLWWFFLATCSVLLLTKPAGRFFLPALLIGLIAAKAWRHLRWQQAAALAAVAGLTFTIGQDSQASWLLYSSAFPLTKIDSPLHAEYKQEIRGMVLDARKSLANFDVNDRSWKRFLKEPEKQSQYPLWQALGSDPKKRSRVYKDLAMEGIRSRPDLFALIAVQRIMSSANAADFKADRFQTEFSPRKFEHLYERYEKESPRRLRMMFGLGKNDPLPPFAEVAKWLEPTPDAAASKAVYGYATWLQSILQLTTTPSSGHAEDGADDGNDDASHDHGPGWPTILGWCLLAGAAISLLPRYFLKMGIWTIAIGMYLVEVFLVGSSNARFFGPAWPLIIPLLFLPLDFLASLLKRTPKNTSEQPAAPAQA